MKGPEQFGPRNRSELARLGCHEPTGCFLGIDVGAETVKVVEVWPEGGTLRLGRREIREHGKRPGPALMELLREWDWSRVQGAAVSGRFSSQVNFPRIPTKQAQLRGYQFQFGVEPGTLVSIGSRGFSVLEVRENGLTVFRENSRCSQGTGNFLRQLIERFSLSVEDASRLCAEITDPAPLSGRCPVILKTDMTHLANKGEDRLRILAGLFDAVCENVLVLIKPGVSPRRVWLAGGVSRSARVRRVLAAALEAQGLEPAFRESEALLDLEALGCAVIAAENGAARLPEPAQLLLPPGELNLERLPSLTQGLAKVRRMPGRPWTEVNGELRRLVLGFDIGSTGAKLVVLDAATHETIWEGYRQTLGDPVGAAQDLLRRFSQTHAARCPVAGFGVTGSGREIVGSLLTACYGKDAVFVVNEIVAHATGALHYDARVDTIFEIGGQDAKYIRLAEGRITDCAMNEACSAGTGSFIEEQGRKFAGVDDVRALGQVAVGAASGVSLGQHCSVFMAEVIDEAVGAGIDQPAIVSGLYDSIIKNYLNRVKGNRSVGKVIFCQGMPFSADALAAAVARETGSEVVVPPNPGTVGALGIALLAIRELGIASQLSSLPVYHQASRAGKTVDASLGLDLSRFLSATVEQKDTFVCRATTGCGGAGNRCRIDRLRTCVDRQRSNFTWGGGCALHDKASRKRKLPDLAPDPFREHEELVRTIIAPFTARRGNPRVALADEFMLKGLFPFFAALFHEVGFDLEILTNAHEGSLKRGIQAANVPFCAPMQLFHGLAEQMGETGAEWVFVPMVRALPMVDGQEHAVVCPIVQAAPDLLRRQIDSPLSTTSHQNGGPHTRLLAPVIDFGPCGVDSKAFVASCGRLAGELGIGKNKWQQAWTAAVRVQRQFEAARLELGRRALEFCRCRQIVPVIVLGRSYTIYNRTLNSNVLAILREQGAIGIPVDCYPLDEGTPIFRDMYWGYGQAVLRAAHQIRRTLGVYALYCSNYSCGPDSFNLHLTAFALEGKPFAIIETDGHSGDAGTKTRVEAFLHCVEEDRGLAANGAPATDVMTLQFSGLGLSAAAAPKPLDANGASSKLVAPLRSAPRPKATAAGAKLLVPYIGPASESVAAVFRGVGLDAECLPPPDLESLRRGRRYTSGKECLPMPLTIGSLLQRLEESRDGERFVYVMPSGYGPCRFGIYSLLNRLVLDRLGWRDRLRIWSPKDTGYFDELPAGVEVLMLAGIIAGDALRQALLDVRPFERERGSAEAYYQDCCRRLLSQLEVAGRCDLTLAAALWQVVTGRLFGISELLKRMGADFAALRGPGERPQVELTGEIYVRGVEFSNDFLIGQLEARGLRVHLAPQSEWLGYCSYARGRRKGLHRLADSVSNYFRHRVEALAMGAIGSRLGWPPQPSIPDLLAAGAPYVNPALLGEAVLTIGGSLTAWRRGRVDAVISVGPLECMPTKIAEAQFHHLAEREGLLSLTLAFNGDPLPAAMLDNFAYEVHARYARKKVRSKATSLSGAGPGHPELNRA